MSRKGTIPERCTGSGRWRPVGWLCVIRKGEFLLRKFVVIILGVASVIVGRFGGISGMQKKFAERTLTVIFAWDKWLRNRATSLKANVRIIVAMLVVGC